MVGLCGWGGIGGGIEGRIRVRFGVKGMVRVSGLG